VPVTHLTNHVVLVGHGRVGRVVSAALKETQTPLLGDPEDNPDATAAVRRQASRRSPATQRIRRSCRPRISRPAKCLLVAIPDAFEGGQVVEQARAISPTLRILARSHSEAETEHLSSMGQRP